MNRPAVILAVIASFVGSIGFGQTAPPSTSQPTAQLDALSADFISQRDQLLDVLGEPKQLSDPARRQAIAPKATPVLKKMLDDLKQLQYLDPKLKTMGFGPQTEYLAFLAVLGDTPATMELQQHADSKDASESIAGVTGQLNVRWLLAGNKIDEQNKVVDDLENVAKAHPDSSPLTLFIASLSQDSDSADVSSRLEKLATETMSNPAVADAKGLIADMKDQKAQMDQVAAGLKKLENQPFELKGKTADGKDFNSSDWKGNVVLVDFWATWCGPCVSEMPKMKRLYDENHDKGLEIVGVSNDRSLDSLNKFTEKNSIPWPQLFDAAAGNTGEWHPASMSFGVKLLPTAFVIDKKGVLRSTEGRKNTDDLVKQLLAE